MDCSLLEAATEFGLEPMLRKGKGAPSDVAHHLPSELTILRGLAPSRRLSHCVPTKHGYPTVRRSQSTNYCSKPQWKHPKARTALWWSCPRSRKCPIRQ